MAEIKEGFETNLDKLSKTSQEVIVANAAFQGITPEQYLQQRGGIDARGRYGDMFDPTRNLTVEEYDAALAQAKASGASGVGLGQALNMAQGKKEFNYFLSQGLSPDQAEKISGYTATGAFSGGAPGGASETANRLFKMFQSGVIDKQTFDKMMSANFSGSEFTSTGAGSATTGTTGFGPGSQGYAERKSAYDLLFEQFNQYGLGALVTPLKGLIESGISPAEFTLRLRDTDAYKKRFAANQQRIAKGLRALSEAEYIGLEDQYQNIMRNYGLPESYYTRGDMGRQEGFEKFIAGDVSAVELEDRIQTAQNRVINAAPEISATLKQFYPNLSNGDILAYVLDPDKALTDIKRKVTAAEIGGAAAMAGLATGVARAEELARYGVTAESARQGYQTIADIAPRGSQLAEIYKQTPYTQTTAEQEVFGLTGATEAATRRKKLQQLEQASFSGSSGMAGGALARDRAGSF